MQKADYIIDYTSADLPVSVKKLRPVIFQEGTQWTVCYGKEDSKNSIQGCGDTLVEALNNFDQKYQEKKHVVVENLRTK